MPVSTLLPAHYYTGGMSGILYAVMGAYLVVFPRSRCYCALNYDLRFWGAIICILLPVTLATRFVGLAFTEIIIVLGMAAAFLLLQPEHGRTSAPVFTIMLYKLLQDVILIEPATHESYQLGSSAIPPPEPSR